MYVGNRVRIYPKGTLIPVAWLNRKLTGTICCLDEDGTVAVDVDGPQAGHDCSLAGRSGTAKNGWWFMPDELALLEPEEGDD